MNTSKKVLCCKTKKPPIGGFFYFAYPMLLHENVIFLQSSIKRRFLKSTFCVPCFVWNTNIIRCGYSIAGNNTDAIDYVDGNKYNCHIGNLEIKDLSLMISQRAKNNGRNTSKYTGVSLHKQTNSNGVPVKEKWLVHLYHIKKLHHIGVFDSEIEAANAYLEAKKNIKK